MGFKVAAISIGVVVAAAATLFGDPARPSAAAPRALPTVSFAEFPIVAADAPALESPAKVDFEKEVMPVFAASCNECHGPKKRKGKLRLDSREFAMHGGETGPAIIAGKSADSLLMKRLRGDGDDDRMPLDHDPLPKAQIDSIARWIDQGAVWPDKVAGDRMDSHWAYLPPTRTAPPAVKDAAWPRNAIDNFILARLEAQGLAPSREADRPTLIRRLSIDLTGLPPNIAEVDAFIADKDPHAYERLVERLLASPHFGERWGRHWLDLARYADTNGYEKDRVRSIWPYRDWVINSINRDLPFNKFVIEQFAGDMLPHPTPDQLIATGFHRNTMLNEEGGIDVEEFRFKALVDRVQTTSSALLGLTMHCAQCHDHKYDAITQKDYYRFMALMNNADEPDYAIPDPKIAQKRAEIESKAQKMESGLAANFPIPQDDLVWQPLAAQSAGTQSSTRLSITADKSISASGAVRDTEDYSITADLSADDLAGLTAIRLEVLTDPALPHGGPGRSGAGNNGNFVLTDFRMEFTGAGGKPAPVKFASASADVSQPGFEIAKAIDADPFKTGWAIDDGSRKFNKTRTAQFNLAPMQALPAGKFTIHLVQGYSAHTLGKFRLSLGRRASAAMAPADSAKARHDRFESEFAAWEKASAAPSVNWRVLPPKSYSRIHEGAITPLPDQSLLFTGDNYYRDTYDLEYQTDLASITAIRIEVLPDERLPKGGPGRGFEGGFLLSELTAEAGPASGALVPIKFQSATADSNNQTILRAIDGKRDTHWTVMEGKQTPRYGVFTFAQPLQNAGGSRIILHILQNYHEQMNLGRVRISVTDAPAPKATGLSSAAESALCLASDKRSAAQRSLLVAEFLAKTPLLASQRAQIAALRAAMPAFQSTLVMAERARPRTTNIHHRGDFDSLRAAVAPGVPSALPQLPKGERPDRLALARWLVSETNPLVGRVVMNRVWMHLMGRPIVNTVDDFGVMGDKPTHPELLDWLATELPRQKWSMKAMIRLIVTSAAYRQSAAASEQDLKLDPENILFGRAGRFRVEAETVRDIALRAAGLLNEQVGGPSVFPPQPAGVTELSYGPMAWPTSVGPQRYRRGMYTFIKRTSIYPMLTTFDAPTSELVCTRRNRSNTPLQALTTLNDPVFMEAAQALARKVMHASPADDARATAMFRSCLARFPTNPELQKLLAFHAAQLKRFAAGELDAKAAAAASPNDAPADLNDIAAWTAAARVLLNLDETLTRE